MNFFSGTFYVPFQSIIFKTLSTITAAFVLSYTLNLVNAVLRPSAKRNQPSSRRAARVEIA